MNWTGGNQSLGEVTPRSRGGFDRDALREQKHAEVQAIEAGAVYQAGKALTIARGYLHDEGLDVVFIPMFVKVEIRGLQRTAIRVMVEPCFRTGDTCHL